jgi:hypothetical protein
MKLQILEGGDFKMGWIYLFLASALLFLLAVPFNRWKHYLWAGVITMIILYAIDSTFIKLGAFSYHYSSFLIGEIPLLHLLSSFFGGILLVHYYPKKRLMQLPYIIFSSFLFLSLELIMNYFDYITYNNWSPTYSFFLDISGFIIVIWLFYWICDTFEINIDSFNNEHIKN